jgi:cytochrome b involved in lipid metabolism
MSKRVIIIGSVVFVAILGGLLILSSISSNSEPTIEITSAEQAVPPSESIQTNENIQVSYSFDEVADHATKNDCWTIIDGIVYDLTEFIASHPGGEVIATLCGLDGTDDFKNQGVPQEEADRFREEVDLAPDAEFHSPDARNILSSYEIGILENKAE